MLKFCVRCFTYIFPYSWRVVLIPRLRGLHSVLQRLEMKWLSVPTTYPHRLVFIAGLPKAGTTWLETLMMSVPDCQKLAWHDPKGRLDEHVLDPVLFEKLPVKGNFFIKTHVAAGAEGVEALRNHAVPTVVMVRDLRDQCVSHFYHVINDSTHPLHNKYKNEQPSKAFSYCVELAATEYAEWCRNWLREIKKDEKLFMLVRYEDLHADTKGTFQRVLKHFEMDLTNERVDDIIREVSIQSKAGLSLAKQLARGKTLRAGRIGDWREYFTPVDVEYLKSNANDVLVALGYEQNENWSNSNLVGGAELGKNASPNSVL